MAVNPAAVREKGGNSAAHIVRQPGAPEGNGRRDAFIHLRIIAHHAAAEISLDGTGGNRVYSDAAVLRMIEATVRGAKSAGKWVGVCGGIAGDPREASLPRLP